MKMKNPGKEDSIPEPDSSDDEAGSLGPAEGHSDEDIEDDGDNGG
jgi:hypothetical protein